MKGDSSLQQLEEEAVCRWSLNPTNKMKASLIGSWQQLPGVTQRCLRQTGLQFSLLGPEIGLSNGSILRSGIVNCANSLSAPAVKPAP